MTTPQIDCDCAGGDQGEGCVSLPHEPHCALLKPSAPQAPHIPSVEELLKSLRKAINFAYTGSAEHGSFLRGGDRGRAEYVPSAFMTLEHLEAAIYAVQQADRQEIETLRGMVNELRRQIQEPPRCYIVWDGDKHVAFRSGGDAAKELERMYVVNADHFKRAEQAERERDALQQQVAQANARAESLQRSLDTMSVTHEQGWQNR